MVNDIGNDAPDFALKAATGDLIRLGNFRGAKRVLLLFYPKDMTSG